MAVDFKIALRNEIKTLQDERVSLSARLAKLDSREKLLRALLAQDEGPDSEPIVFESDSTLSPLILDALKGGPKSLSELKKIGENWPQLRASRSPGRSINFTLVALQRGDHVERSDTGLWKLPRSKK